MPRTQAVVKAVEVKDLQVGDKLIVDIIGYQNKVLINRGTNISSREVLWIAKKLKENPPKNPTIKYRTLTKAMGDIKDAKGALLVKRNAIITEEALAPLLKEGFTAVEAFEAGSKMFYKKQDWTAKSNIAEFNPLVQVERVEIVNDEPAKTPAATK